MLPIERRHYWLSKREATLRSQPIPYPHRSIANLYPNSNHVYKLGLDRSPDVQVWDYAKKENFLIVTKDADFSDLCLLLGFPPKVVWIRRRNCKTSEIELILRRHREDIKELQNNDATGLLTLF